MHFDAFYLPTNTYDIFSIIVYIEMGGNADTDIHILPPSYLQVYSDTQVDRSSLRYTPSNSTLTTVMKRKKGQDSLSFPRKDASRSYSPEPSTSAQTVVKELPPRGHCALRMRGTFVFITFGK